MSEGWPRSFRSCEIASFSLQVCPRGQYVQCGGDYVPVGEAATVRGFCRTLAARAGCQSAAPDVCKKALCGDETGRARLPFSSRDLGNAPRILESMKEPKTEKLPRKSGYDEPHPQTNKRGKQPDAETPHEPQNTPARKPYPSSG